MTKAKTKTGVEWMSVEECADILNVGKMTMYREIERKNIRAIRVGRSVRIHRGELEDYIRKAAAHADDVKAETTSAMARWIRATEQQASA